MWRFRHTLKRKHPVYIKIKFFLDIFMVETNLIIVTKFILVSNIFFFQCLAFLKPKKEKLAFYFGT